MAPQPQLDSLDGTARTHQSKWFCCRRALLHICLQHCCATGRVRSCVVSGGGSCPPRTCSVLKGHWPRASENLVAEVNRWRDPQRWGCRVGLSRARRRATHRAAVETCATASYADGPFVSRSRGLQQVLCGRRHAREAWRPPLDLPPSLTPSLRAGLRSGLFLWGVGHGGETVQGVDNLAEFGRESVPWSLLDGAEPDFAVPSRSIGRAGGLAPVGFREIRLRHIERVGCADSRSRPSSLRPSPARSGDPPWGSGAFTTS